jgi:hypothetical protein
MVAKTPLSNKTQAAEHPGSIVESFNRSNGSQPPTVPEPEAPTGEISQQDRATLDEAERLAADCILDSDDGNEPGENDEIKITPIQKNLPKYAVFMSKPICDLWATALQQGMKDLIFTTTKTFAPRFEDDVDLRRCRFYETVTHPDNVLRVIWAFLPEASERSSNLWTETKYQAMEFAKTQWTTMRSRTKLQQYTYRGEPRFSNLTPQQYLMKFKEQGVLVVGEDHHFFKTATDTE